MNIMKIVEKATHPVAECSGEFWYPADLRGAAKCPACGKSLEDSISEHIEYCSECGGVDEQRCSCGIVFTNCNCSTVYHAVTADGGIHHSCPCGLVNYAGEICGKICSDCPPCP